MYKVHVHVCACMSVVKVRDKPPVHILCFFAHSFTCVIYMYIHVYTCVYMQVHVYTHVYTCSCMCVELFLV